MRNKNKKNILLVGSNEFFSLEGMYLRAFKKANCDVKIFHIYNINKNLFSRFIWKYFRFFLFCQQRYRLQKYIKKNINKYDLIIIFKGLYLTKKFIINLKKISHNSKFINIYPDDPFDKNYFSDISNKSLFKSLKYFDYIFIYSQKIKKKLKLTLSKNKIIYLPFAHDPAIHIRQKLFHKHLYDISFIGTADKERYNIIRQLKDYKIVIGGNGWDRYKQLKNVVYLGAINTQLSANVIRKSTISLNLLRKQNYGSHNMRTFEIPAMGGLMLTKRSTEQNLFFKENVDCLMYGNFKDLNNKIKLVLNNKSKFEKIKNNGHKLSKKYTYLLNVRKILKLIYS
jgi:spore maturation protein CgeB